MADEAIKRLPGINRIIQQAVKDNTKTKSVLGDASEKTDDALETIGLLDNLVNELEVKLFIVCGPRKRVYLKN